MCGIAGLLNCAGDPEPRLASMLAAMGHRGPDGRGSLCFPGGAAGSVRLALVDLSERGVQPLWSPDRRVAILFNGEIYNHAAERAWLADQGYPFQSATDTEVVLALYLEQGLHFVDRLRGMFAVALLDWRDAPPDGPPAVVLARDPLGIKPLFLAQPAGPSGPLLFASELRSLLASGLVPRTLDREALLDYLAIGFVLQPRSILAGVRMLERGSLLRLAPGGSREERVFWRMPPAEPSGETLEAASARLRSVLEESVRLHALADAPVGAFLSGGVDSTGVVSLMVRNNPRLRTYTVRLPDVPGADESELALTASRALGCEPAVVEMTGRDARSLLPRFAGELDQPSNDGLNTWVVSRAAARDVKGVLSGLGGDEWFAGYPVARRMARFASGSGRVHRLAGRISAALRPVFPGNGRVGQRLEELAARANAFATWLHDHRVFGYPAARRLLAASGPAEGESGVERLLPLAGPEWWRESPVGLACLLDVGAYMGCQLLRDADAASMAHSLELRVPLVDVRVAEFARSCPEEYKLARGGGAGSEYGASGAKRILLHALRDVLPADMPRRPKRGFALPYDHWARHELAPLIKETCSREAVAARGLLDPEIVAELSAGSSVSRRWAGWPHAWALMILELWCRAVLDAPAPSQTPGRAAYAVQSGAVDSAGTAASPVL